MVAMWAPARAASMTWRGGGGVGGVTTGGGRKTADVRQARLGDGYLDHYVGVPGRDASRLLHQPLHIAGEALGGDGPVNDAGDLQNDLAVVTAAGLGPQAGVGGDAGENAQVRRRPALFDAGRIQE